MLEHLVAPLTVNTLSQYLFSRLRVEADRSLEHELKGRVANSFNNVKRLGRVSGLHTFKESLSVCKEDDSHLDFQM